MKLPVLIAAAQRGWLGAPAPELVLIDRTAGTNIGDMTGGGGLAASFDGDTTQAAAAGSIKGTTTSAFVGKTLAAERVFGRLVAYGSTDNGFRGTNATVTLTVRGKVGAAPSSATDGTTLGVLAFTDTADESAGRTIDSTDLVNEWDHVWLTLTGTLDSYVVVELELYAWEVPA